MQSNMDTIYREELIKEEIENQEVGNFVTVSEVKEALEWLQKSITDNWGVWTEDIARDNSRLIHENENIIILTTKQDKIPNRELIDHKSNPVKKEVAAVCHSVHLSVAKDRCSYDWSHEYPLVVVKSDKFEHGQMYVEAIINSLINRGLSPGQAWSYYGVEIRGASRNQWSKRCGYTDHSAVSEPLRKAKQKL